MEFTFKILSCDYSVKDGRDDIIEDLWHYVVLLYTVNPLLPEFFLS